MFPLENVKICKGVGIMNVLLVGINSKFIHPNVAIRLLKKNSKNNVSLKEYTIKDDVEEIINYINSSDAEIVGLSVYIWNVNIIRSILPKLKKKILLGGPEVSFDNNEYFEHVDYILRGESEKSFDILLDNLDNLEVVPGLSYKKDLVIHNKMIEPTLDIEFANDIDFSKHQIQYIETSRGCPYKCSYCLASLEEKVRYFPTEQIINNINGLIKGGAKTFKFLDRTFNLNISKSVEVINYIIEHHRPGNSFQFEITGDILDERIMNAIHKAPVGLFRFEIGIQSTNDKTNEAVDRKQDTEKLFSVIDEIQTAGIVDLHVDLIAGLPYEDLNSFKKTFNDTFSLGVKELQLGFLKLLKGTKLRFQADKWGYEYGDAPYELIKSDFLSESDISKIHTVEEVLEKYWNSGYLTESLKIIMDDPFDFFLEYGEYYESKYSWFNYQLSDLFKRLYDYVDKGHEQIIIDYLNYHKVKPKRWWTPLDKSVKNNVLRLFYEEDKTYTLQELYKYSVVEKVDNYIIKVYKPENINIYKRDYKL